ncbi:MAG TPA: DUF4340 domain-containing protein [Vicinamibacterales bacterium]|nr:DUF4340 domain-containing protein [Vicinamibacterales bacterium]
MRGIWSTLALVVILAGLGAYIYFVDRNRPAASSSVEGEPAREKFFTVETDKITEIKLTSKGQTTLLRKSEGGWKMIEPVQADADPPEAISLAQAITNIESVRPVVDNPPDLKQFGLADPPITVEFKAEGGASGSFKLGNKNPTQTEIYAQKGGDNRVVLVSSFQESSFTKEPFALRDRKILKFDRDKADSITLARGANAMELSRSDSEWKVARPLAGRSDYSAIEGFLTRLSSANMSTLVEENPTDLAKYGLDKPAMTVTVGAGSSKATLMVGKTEKDQTYAKDASRPIVFTVDSTLQTDLNKSFDDYRKKELFEFRPFGLARMRAVLDAPGGPKTYEFEKVAAAKPGDAETWKVTRIGGSSHNADAAAMDDLLNKLVAIRAESFVAGNTRTGLDKPALVVSVSYDEGKFERVRFGAVGDNAYGRRDGEELVAKVDANSMKAAMQAFDLVTIPKEPETKADDTKKPEEKK